MRTFGWACALALVVACDDDDGVTPAVLDQTPLGPGIDASAPLPDLDSGEYVTTTDSAALVPTCPPIDICKDGKPGLLYNVCISGAASGAVSQPACLVDPNGTLYLAPLTSGQLVVSQGWQLSTNATLSAADQARCETARADLLVDASTPPKCAGGQ